MKAIVVEHAGAPDVLQIRTLPRPQPRPGWVLIQVKDVYAAGTFTERQISTGARH